MENNDNNTIEWGFNKKEPLNIRSKEHQDFLIEQYNRNRPIEKQVKSMPEYIEALENNDVKHHGMRSVTITERRVYHKVAKLTIELPEDIPQNDVHQWLMDNEDKWEKDLDKSLADADYKFGFGFEYRRGMDDHDHETESRYDINGENYGGHI